MFRTGTKGGGVGWDVVLGGGGGGGVGVGDCWDDGEVLYEKIAVVIWWCEQSKAAKGQIHPAPA